MLRLLAPERQRANRLATNWVQPDPSRCVQCGICAYNCPLGIDVRSYAWRGEPVREPRCLACSQCVSRCPRGALRFVPIDTTPERFSPGIGANEPDEVV